MRELIGFITANSTRQHVLELLNNKGPLKSSYIAKSSHVPGMMVDKTLKELADHKLVVVKNGKYMLTEEGEQLIKYVSTMEHD